MQTDSYKTVDNYSEYGPTSQAVAYLQNYKKTLSILKPFTAAFFLRHPQLHWLPSPALFAPQGPDSVRQAHIWRAPYH